MRKKVLLIDALIILFMIAVCIVTIYPFINTLAVSLNDGMDANRGGIYMWPREFSLQSYQVLFRDDTILQALFITFSRTFIGIIIAVPCTAILAYGLSKKALAGRNFYILICIVGLIFNGGLIPTYFLYNDFGLLDTFWVYIIPNVINIWYMLLMKTFFEQLPIEVEEAAQIDGCGTWRTLFTVIFPMSMPIIATICIFVGVEQWNSWYDAYVFTDSEKLQPIQTYLFKLIALNQAPPMDVGTSLTDRARVTGRTVSAAAVIVTMVPISCIYFMFQKYFTQGMMVGAVKG